MTFISLTLTQRVITMAIMKKQIEKLMSFCLLCMTVAMPAQAYVNRDVAVLRIMNKAAGKAQTVRIPVGKHATFEKLNVLVRTCKQTDPFQAEDFFAFVEINKNDEGRIFSGWQSRNEPGDNPVQNADYDVWLVGCE